MNGVIDVLSRCNELHHKISLPSYRDEGTLAARGRCRVWQWS